MHLSLRSCARVAFCLVLMIPGVASSADAMIIWPEGWEVEALPQPPPSEGQLTVQIRQRAVKNDQDGTPTLVMELTMTQVESGHQVNLEGVLLEMRKAVQKDFFQSGYQSVCNKIHETRLSRLPALETTCTITQNGRHVLSQTLVAAVDGDKAYVLSYAGQADVYKASQEEIAAARNSLQL